MGKIFFSLFLNTFLILFLLSVTAQYSFAIPCSQCDNFDANCNATCEQSGVNSGPTGDGGLGRIGEGLGMGPFSNIATNIEDAGTAFESVISMIIGVITLAGSLWFLFQVFLGGLNWLTAGGDTKNLEAARNRITNGVVGLIILVAAWAIIGIAGNIFGLNILEPSLILPSLILGGTP